MTRSGIRNDGVWLAMTEGAVVRRWLMRGWLVPLPPHSDAPAPAPPAKAVTTSSLRGRRPWQSRVFAKVGVIASGQAVLDCFATLAMTREGVARNDWGCCGAAMGDDRFAEMLASVEVRGGCLPLDLFWGRSLNC